MSYYIKQTYTNGEIFTPFIMNRMEDALSEDVLVVPVDATDSNVGFYSTGVSYDVVEEALLNRKLVIYRITRFVSTDLSNITTDCYATLSWDQSYIIVNNLYNGTVYSHTSNNKFYLYNYFGAD